MIKATLTAVLLSSVALVPAATIALVASADAVEAKGGNGNGNGGGNGAGNGGGNKGGKSAGAKANKGTKSASGGGKSKSRRSGKDPIGNFLRKVTGQDKKKAARTKVARAPKDPMHPSNLGKMNGPLNANVNALIAHVKNGNTNGPIGGMAALAVAGYAAEGAAETLELEQLFADLDQALIDNGYTDMDGNADLQAYLDALEPIPGNGVNVTIEDAVTGAEGALPIEDALLGANNGVQDFASVEEYEAWRDGTDGADPIEDVDNLIGDIGDQERPSQEEIDYANERIEDRTAAEDYMLSIWNKGDGDDSVRSESEEALLEKLYERIEADGEELDMAIEEHADLPEEPTEEEVTSCEGEEGCEEEEIVVAAE